MLTPVERVMILKNIDLLANVGPRLLVPLAEITREQEIWKGQTIYEERDPADALYVVVEGRVELATGDRVLSEVGPGQAFGTWSLIDDSERGQRAACLEDGFVLTLLREDFYEVAAHDLTLLRELLRLLARRLRKLVEERPEEAHVEEEGIDDRSSGAGLIDVEAEEPGGAVQAGQGATLEAAVLDKSPVDKASADKTPNPPGVGLRTTEQDPGKQPPEP